MSIVDRIFVGEIVKDFGVVYSEKLRGVRSSVSVLLARRRGKQQLYLKFSTRAFFGASVSYQPVSSDVLLRLEEAGREASHFMQGPAASSAL